MEPKDPNKKFEDLFKNISFSFHTVPINSFNLFPKQETVEEVIERLDFVDENVDAMTSYPAAERMLNDLFNKDK